MTTNILGHLKKQQRELLELRLETLSEFIGEYYLILPCKILRKLQQAETKLQKKIKELPQ